MSKNNPFMPDRWHEMRENVKRETAVNKFDAMLGEMLPGFQAMIDSMILSGDYNDDLIPRRLPRDFLRPPENDRKLPFFNTGRLMPSRKIVDINQPEYQHGGLIISCGVDYSYKSRFGFPFAANVVDESGDNDGK
jgi:hypothetical protein